MELKEIKTEQILANFYQPRTKFDREKIKELAESILSNGLINPITVTPDKKRKGKFMIVSGERRWQAHKIAKIKNIPCVVKDYKSSGQFMIDSLIENIHREDLSPEEKGKFANRIMKEERIPNVNQLAKRLSVPYNDIVFWSGVVDIKKKIKGKVAAAATVADSVIIETKGLPEREQVMLIKQAAKEDFGKMEMRRRVKEIKSEPSPEPVEFERTADDVVDDILSNLHDFKYHVDELIKSPNKDAINIDDLSKSKADRAITTSSLHIKNFIKFVNALRQRGAKPDKLILALIRANNGKV